MKPRAAIVQRRTESAVTETLHPVGLLDRLLKQRGVLSARELDFALAELPGYEKLPAIEPAVDRLQAALEQQQRITVIGDYDCDGATSTALALLALQQFGASDVNYLVPNRFEFGYGLSAAIVDVAAERQPALLLTVDNGVASNEGVARANALGIDVVVTDHHLPPEELPAAVAIVNPNLDGCEFQSGALAGVGVIFYLMLALRARLKRNGYFDASRPEPRLADLLDLVAIGTVADVVPLDQVNRTLVEQGLRRIRAGKTRPGVLALCEVAGRTPQQLSASDIGFAIGPRLNAAGRLDDISVGIQCLLADSRVQAAQLAKELNSLNQDRRQIEQGMRKEADVLVSRTLAALPKGQQVMSLCLYEPHWHQGVIGILAGRLKEELNIPVIVFAADDPDDSSADISLKGSGRSIPGLHIRDAMMAVAAHSPGLLKKFGGHAMAAGLSLNHSDLATFAAAFDVEVRAALDNQAPTRQWITDGSLELTEFSLENAELLRFACPWGQGFPEPVFDERFTVVSWRLLKERHMKMQLQPEGSDQVFEAIAFNQRLEDPAGNTYHMVFRLEVNTFRNRQSLQLQVLYIDS
ncbi:MAG: single-stranded-DNA-specific exonuclease RecJ [Gammaproteobacteria bacterium]|nr:single-stranded-DNA-specific exonuclease RecJ [Gammaproteobacteria bacterium]